MLGEADRPWLGVTLREPEVEAALDEATEPDRRRHRPDPDRGADRARAGGPVDRRGPRRPEWQPRERDGAAGREPIESAPTGSQRALARLRRAIDRAAARRRAYVRLATATPALGAPEGAVVAAFERIDLLASDAMAEIVGRRRRARPRPRRPCLRPPARPARRDDDHRRPGPAGRRAGPVVRRAVRPGHPRRPGARAPAPRRHAGARRRPAAPTRSSSGALPPWLTDETAPGARAIAEVAVRRALFPAHPLGFVEPPDRDRPLDPVAVRPGRGGRPWRRHRARPARGRFRPGRPGRGGALGAGRVAGLGRRRRRHRARPAPRDRARPRPRDGRGGGRDPRSAGDQGWRTVAGDPPGSRSRPRREVATERTECFDPFAMLLGPRG